MSNRTRRYHAEDGSEVICHLDFPGRPLFFDQGESGAVYIEIPDPRPGYDSGGVSLRSHLLLKPVAGREFFYVGHHDDGRLELPANTTYSVTLSAETVQAIARWAQAGGGAIDHRRGRLSTLAV
jgi:hypothetical protein